MMIMSFFLTLGLVSDAKLTEYLI